MTGKIWKIYEWVQGWATRAKELRTRRLSLLLTTVTDLYDGNRESLSIELKRRVEITLNQLTLKGLGRSGAVVQELQRVYREGLRSHEELIRKSLQPVLKSNRFVPRGREVDQINDFILERMKPLATSFENIVSTHARNAGFEHLPKHQELDSGLDTRIRGEVALLVADLKRELIPLWKDSPLGMILISVATFVLGYLVLWYFGIL